MVRSRFLTLAASVCLAACADGTPVGVDADLTTKRAADAPPSTSPIWKQVVEGTTGPGALYALYLPRDWNGDVIYYIHGLYPAEAPVALPANDNLPAIRDALGAAHYAVAYSSFSENGWAVKDGAQRTHQLRGIFTSYFGKPTHSYLVGVSLGGLIGEQLAERHGNQYDGLLAACAPLGGATAEVNYLANVRIVFDALFPGVLPGDALNVPAGVDFTTQIQPLLLNLFANPANPDVLANQQKLGIIASLAQTPLAGANGSEVLASLIYAIGYNFRGASDLLDRTHDHSFIDNSTVVYSSAIPGLVPAPVLALINVTADRFTATPDAANYFERYYEPTGALQMPTVTLHTTRDPLVPYFHEALFAQRVAAEGASSLLVQRSVDRFGHCAFQPAEVLGAFQTLAGWVQTGVHP